VDRGPVGRAGVFPLSELSIQIVNALVISLLPPSRLPKMDFESGIPPEHATLVVIPMMLASTGVVRGELEKLETRFPGRTRKPTCSTACSPISRIRWIR